MHVAWATDCEGVGNAYGHTLGNRLGREALASAGVEIDPDAEIAVHHCPPHAFRPMPGKVNVLWAAWEFPELLPSEVEGLRKADVIFATARFLVDVFEEASGVPAFYVPQGIRTEVFTEAKRKKPSLRLGQKFRFLWVGAPNDRKGWKHLLAAWKLFAADPACELYLKTTFASHALQSAGYGNVTIDTEQRTDEQLAALYRSAHCFVFPSMGEGFGFTLGEAMASGLPCIYTPATALEDLSDPCCGYPIRFDMARCFEIQDVADGKTYTLPAANPDVRDLARQMARVRRDYGAALNKGHLAACRIRKQFTWRQAGRKLKHKLELVADALRPAEPAVSTCS